ncbi:hypothetical protein RRG08_010296 [Elysia crispata]|uniref:Uncharacterized protein n=1 Tax=Elysia crispata TaxID=231223 RepID=A0AAE0Z2I7_9GAST|nr:hypothetical protein RRG08_010296 [Elysia crispata]
MESSDSTQAKPRPVRTMVCPDRTRKGALKRPGGKVDDDLVGALPKKHYCSGCLNTNLISVNSVAAIMERLRSCCTYCGKLWSTIPESRKRHMDNHLEIPMPQPNLPAPKSYSAIIKMDERKTTSTAHGLYYKDAVKDKENTKIVSKFSKMKPSDQMKYLAAARGVLQRDSHCLSNTVYDGRLELRPSLADASVSHPMDPNVTMLAVHLMEKVDMRNLDVVLRDRRRKHMVYENIVPLTNTNWGMHDYVCYICTDNVRMEMEGNRYMDQPHLRDIRVCTCSAHNDDHHQGSVVPSCHPVHQLTDGEDALCYSHQIAVHFRDNKHFLFVCTSMYSGYVIHAGCCDFRHSLNTASTIG